ncbi:MAG: hypothetical protein ABIP30_11005 [Ferruginibacter sp.]
MNQFKNTMITCFSIFGFIALCFLLFGDREKFSMIGLTGFLLGIGYFLIGLLLTFFPSTRQVGKAMLIASGVLLLIGVSVCSIAPLAMNMH